MTEHERNWDDNILWFKEAIIYELHIKAFRDGNGDGIGDFKGLLEKLDYLQDLGITTIWLLPFYPSPLKDDGYDIADYYSINPSYGNVEEFRQLLREAHSRNLKVITELVINHTSDQHPWFQRARVSPKGSPYRDFYVWTDDPNQYKDVRIIFQDFETSNWTWDPVANQYFWHRFYSHQPDLNYDSPLVQSEVFKMIDYWCSMGVDGFRLDAIPYLFEREGTNGENLPETHEFLKKLRAYVDSKYPGTIFLAEANMWPEDSASYFGDGDECHMNYHFPLMPRMFMALQMEDRYPITDIFDQTPEIPANCQWAIFLRNHDELTLEMVTDEERDYMYKVYVKDPRARINLGIRHRLAPLMGGNRKKIELLNYLLFSLPGTPVIYYGDEIGMGDNFYLGDRNGVRTPMQWDSGRNSGFSDANPQKLYLPLILDPDYQYESVNVEMQSHNTSSLLWWMKRIINKRKQYKALSHGDLKFIACDNSKILAFTRSFEDEVILVIVNLSRYTQPVELDLDAFKGYMPVEVFSKNKFPSVKDQLYFFTLGGYDCEWFVMEKVHPSVDQKKPLYHIEIPKWNTLGDNGTLRKVENVLADYLVTTRWFEGKNRMIESLRVSNVSTLPLEQNPVYILLIEVGYQSGLPEMYQLPMAFAAGEYATKLKGSCPQSVISSAKVGDEEGILYDACYGTEYQETLLRNIAGNKSYQQKDGSITFHGNDIVSSYVNSGGNIKPRIFKDDHTHTLIYYDNKFGIKVYRKLEIGIVNPDVEMIQFLSGSTSFNGVYPYAGAIELTLERESIVLAVVQEIVESSGDTWKYILDRLDDFNEQILTHPDIVAPPEEVRGSFYNPVVYEETPEAMRELIDGSLAERIHLLGVRIGDMHKALSLSSSPAFKPERYSLHYQRSLFAGFLSLVRSTFSNLSKNIKNLPENVRPQAEEVLAMKHDILAELRNIYKNKIDVDRIRIHGDFHLEQIQFTGKDFIFNNFDGEPFRPYSERRIKRSPIRDVAAMVRSFHYAAYGSLFLDNQIRKEDYGKLTPFVEQWYHYISNFFVKAYLDTVKGTTFIPREREEFRILLKSFLLEKAIYELNYDLNNRREWVIVPLAGIRFTMLQSDVEHLNPQLLKTDSTRIFQNN